MAQLNGVFNADEYEDLGSFDPIPRGEYPMIITASDLKETKDRQGKYIKFEQTIIDGEYKGRKVWNNINIVNKNPVAVEIAEKTLATLIRAVGKKVVADTQELHGIPFTGVVGIQPATDDYPASNKMVTYKPIKEGVTYDVAPTETPDFVKTKKKKDPDPAAKKSGVPWE